MKEKIEQYENVMDMLTPLDVVDKLKQIKAEFELLKEKK